MNNTLSIITDSELDSRLSLASLASTRCNSPVEPPQADDSWPWIQPEFPLSVQPTAYGGRGFYADTRGRPNGISAGIAAGTVVLECPSPFVSVVYRPFKKEVCATCFEYNLGRPHKVKLARDAAGGRAYAGVHFCTSRCRDVWVDKEDYDGVMSDCLDAVEGAYIASSKQVKSAADIETTKIKPIVDQVKGIASEGPGSIAKITLILDAVWAPYEAQVDVQCSQREGHGSSKKGRGGAGAGGAGPGKLEVEEIDMARLVTGVVVQKYRAVTLKDPLAMRNVGNFDTLQSNESQLVQQFPELLGSHLAIFKFLQRVLPPVVRAHVTPALVRQTVGREAGNAFGIWQLPLDFESECLGAALYSEASFFNHSCGPDVKKERIGRSMVFTTTRDIEPRAELYISYGMIQHLSFQERQTKLRDQWHFECSCDVCESEQPKQQ